MLQAGKSNGLSLYRQVVSAIGRCSFNIPLTSRFPELDHAMLCTEKHDPLIYIHLHYAYVLISFFQIPQDAV